MEITKATSRWGNSAGVLLPREWLGKEVKIILVDRTIQIKKEVLDILSPYLSDMQGIYLVGSYARNEQTPRSDIDIIAVSGRMNKEINSGKYHISVITIESVRKVLEKNPIMLYPRLLEAKTLLNEPMLNELKSIRLTKNDFRGFFEDTQRIIKINKELISDIPESLKFDFSNVVYSIVLRLRGVFIIKSILEKKKNTNKEFKKWILDEFNGDEIEKAISVYKDVKDDKKPTERISLELTQKLLQFLEKKVRDYE